MDNTPCCDLNNEKELREVTVKIGLERVDTQEGVIVEILLDNGATVLVMSSEFARKQKFKLKKIEKPIYVRNVDGSFNKEGPIEHMVEVNIYYQRHRERMKIDIIEEQKQSVILGMLQLAHHNSEIDWRTEEAQKSAENSGGQSKGSQNSRRRRKEIRRERTKRKRKEKEKLKKERIIEVKKIAEEWEIWDEEEEVAKLEEETKKLVPECFHKQIYVFGKKTVRKNAHQKDIGPYNRNKRKICTKKKKNISIVERRERRGVGVHRGTIKERIYQTLKVASNSTGIFCKKEEW